MYFTIDITMFSKKRRTIYVCICIYIQYLYIHKEFVGFFALEETNRILGAMTKIYFSLHVLFATLVFIRYM